MKKYQIIYADPPWRYRNRRETRNDGKKPKFGIGAVGHYDTMADEDIYNLPVQNITDKNAALFLWATGPKLDIAIETIKRWGFRFVGKAFNWVKTYPNGSDFYGPGAYNRSNTEDLLLGIKGSFRPLKGLHQVVTTLHPRYDKEKRPHSFKPQIFRDKIEEMYGKVDRIELFARIQAPGWDATGWELDKKDIRDFLAYGFTIDCPFYDSIVPVTYQFYKDFDKSKCEECKLNRIYDEKEWELFMKHYRFMKKLDEYLILKNGFETEKSEYNDIE